jgi:hypothetical protein
MQHGVWRFLPIGVPLVTLATLGLLIPSALTEVLRLADAAIFLILLYLLWLAWLSQPSPTYEAVTSNVTAERQLAAAVTMEACKAGLTVGGIIFSALVAIEVVALKPAAGDSVAIAAPALLQDLRLIAAWIVISLLAGLVNLYLLPSLAGMTLVNHVRLIGMIAGMQICALAAAMIRSLSLVMWLS